MRKFELILWGYVLKKTFRERAVFTAAKVTKKCSLLKPLVFLILGIVLGVLALLRYFAANGKKYITASLVLVFFFMCSSFTKAGSLTDNDIYLDSAKLEDTVDAADIAPITEEVLQPTVPIEVSEDTEEEGFLVDIDAEIAKEIDGESFSIKDVEIKHDYTDEADTSAFDKNAWYLILVNKTHPIPDDYEVPLATITGNMQCDKRVLGPLLDMLNAANSQGIGLYVTSPYRSGYLQNVLFTRRIKVLMNDYGYSYMDAYKSVSRKVIVPGTSEHQLGMCFDIVTGYHSTLDYEFGDTPAGIWLRKHCAEYGFILRYPRGKESITGIEYEPWHFRYVGVEAAQYIMEHGLTLEEFLEEL